MKTINFIFLLLLLSCGKASKNPIKIALSSSNPKIKKVVDSLEKHEVQILFTLVKRSTDNQVSFEDYAFNANEKNYFYPASTVKFPVAILALEKIQRGKNIDSNTDFYVEGDSTVTTFIKEIQKIFAVSDNEANNRLFEFLGQDYINAELNKKGITARISHRLSTENSDDVVTKPLVFYLNDSTTINTQKIISKPLKPLDLDKLKKGKGFMDEGELINQPMDFAFKNYFPLRSQHQMMKQLVYPENFPEKKQFELSENNRKLLLNAMKSLPKDVGYTGDEYYDSYGKFLIFGDSKADIPSHIEIYNKVGYAYGTLTDCAYIKNTKTDEEFIVSATVLVNANGIFNDNNYGYETIGIPFLAALGRQLIGVQPVE